MLVMFVCVLVVCVCVFVVCACVFCVSGCCGVFVVWACWIAVRKNRVPKVG